MLSISLAGSDRQGDLESLADWLRGEPELAGSVSSSGSRPAEGQLGLLGDALLVAVGSGGTLSVLATSLKAWLSQPRRSKIRVRVQHAGGQTIEIDADRVSKEDVEELLHKALGSTIAEE